MAENNQINYFKYIVEMIVKPIQTCIAGIKQINSTKKRLTFSILIVIFMTTIVVIKNMIYAFFAIKGYSHGPYVCDNCPSFESYSPYIISNLKHVNYLMIILKGLITYTVIIFLIALIYHVIGLLFKKDNNYLKNVFIVSSVLIPYTIFGNILCPLFDTISPTLYEISIYIINIYTIIVLLKLENKEIVFDRKGIKVCFNIICFILVAITVYCSTLLSLLI